MKKLFAVSLLLGTLAAPSAQAMNTCMVNRDGLITNSPCIMGKKAAQMAFMRMMLNNVAGHQALVSTRNHSRLEMVGLIDNTMRAISLHDGPEGNLFYKSVIRFEVAMDDCGSTDTCGSKFMWTATETLNGDGYNTDSEYTNSVALVSAFPSWVRGANE